MYTLSLHDALPISPLRPKSSTNNPMTTMAEQTMSSHDRRLHTSFKLMKKGFMGSASEEILYLKMRLLRKAERQRAKNGSRRGRSVRRAGPQATLCHFELCCASRYR